MTAGRGGDRFVRRRFAARLGRFRWIWICLAFAAVVAGLGWVVLFSSWLGVGTVSVQGEKSVPAARIREVAAVGHGTPLARVDTDAVQRRVEQLRRIENVNVHRSWPRTLRVEVRERTPIAVVVGDGKKRVLDRHGVLFDPAGKRTRSLPKVEVTAEGDARSDAVRSDALSEVAEVVAALDRSIAKKVEHVEASSMDAIVLVLRSGDEVHWGSAAESGRKAAVLRRLLEIPAETYDVSAPERPTTKS